MWNPPAPAKIIRTRSSECVLIILLAVLCDEEPLKFPLKRKFNRVCAKLHYILMQNLDANIGSEFSARYCLSNIFVYPNRPVYAVVQHQKSSSTSKKFRDTAEILLMRYPFYLFTAMQFLIYPIKFCGL